MKIEIIIIPEMIVTTAEKYKSMKNKISRKIILHYNENLFMHILTRSFLKIDDRGLYIRIMS